MPTSHARAMTPEDLTHIQWPSDPQLSPDGQRVAFVVTTLSVEQDAYLSNIWLVDTSGGLLRRFTTGPWRDTAPRWSPDGTRLAFLSEREPHKKAQLYVMPADGGEARRLTDLVHGVSQPVWSPDSTRLACVARVGGWQEPDDPDERQKSKPARVITSLKYKFNGDGFVYDRRPHIFVVPADGGPVQQVTDGDYVDGDPAWSPDSQTIAFTSARHAERDDDHAADVWLVAATGGEPRRLTDTAGPVSLPVFAPDGQRLAFLGHRYRHDAGRNLRLWTIPLAGGVPTCLTPDLDRTCAPFFGAISPQWSVDGAWLTFTVEDQGAVPVYRVWASGGKAPEAIVSGERQVTGMAHGTTHLALTVTNPVSPGEVVVCRADGTEVCPLTALNRPWQADVALSQPQCWRYVRAGYTLDCWVMPPYGYTPGQRYPALLVIHGGPHTQYGVNFFDEFQVYAGAGYGVIYTNPRGSQGYGEAFTRAVHGDWGGGDYADVMAGLDEALRQCPWIDPERLGILGGSYGGFLTSWAVAHTTRFKAACSERAVNNLHTLFGTSDIGASFLEAQSGALPWEDPQWYVAHSPLTYARHITTPLLILHAENDLRCPVEQAEQLFVVLKRLRRAVKLVRFPDENHDMSRTGTPRHRLERFRYLLAWFAQYI